LSPLVFPWPTNADLNRPPEVVKDVPKTGDLVFEINQALMEPFKPYTVSFARIAISCDAEHEGKQCEFPAYEDARSLAAV
jgi:hypothetical protein